MAKEGDKPIKNGDKTYTDPRTGKFVKGNPGGGRPEGSFSLTELIRREIQKVPKGKQKSYAEQFVKKLLDKAIKEGDHATEKLIMNYLEGMPREKSDVTIHLPIPILGGITKKDEVRKDNGDKKGNSTRETN